MPTPWLRVKRDAAGKIIDAESPVGANGGMDPFGKAYDGTPTYCMTRAVIPELAADLRRE